MPNLSFLCLVLVLLAGCDRAPPYRSYEGATMGTYYRVTARCPEDAAAPIEAELDLVNREMSTYRADSVLSRFNAMPGSSWRDVPRSLAEVVDAARVLSEQSAGAFDITVGPLVNLWGFGPEHAEGPPSRAAVTEALDGIGFAAVDVQLDPPRLRKRADRYLDLSAIAKGHGVDRVAARLEGAGCDAFLVDVGGEVKGAGLSPSGRPWRIGVEVPDPERRGAVQRVVHLSGGAIATSGDYRNFIDTPERRYSHTIDPRTGYPVSHGLASVSVLHPSAMWADGYATLITVLGPDHGLAFAERHGLPVMLVVRGENGFEERYTSGFEAALAH